jgi:hypothetical protein
MFFNPSIFSDGAGLNCFSCGSLLDPSRKCDKFDPSDPSQVQVCGRNEACLLYTWKKSGSDTGSNEKTVPSRIVVSRDAPVNPGKIS